MFKSIFGFKKKPSLSIFPNTASASVSSLALLLALVMLNVLPWDKLARLPALLAVMVGWPDELEYEMAKLP